jgi:hypothetical protein
MKTLILSVILVSMFVPAESHPCTVILVSDSTVALAGSNEDFTFPLTIVWYVPAKENSYARVCLGYNMIFNSVQGGMNEKGLFVDGNSVGKHGWEADENKDTPFGSVLDRLLATCANVEEVKEYFNTYNVPALDAARIPVMDKSGAKMIVEWHDGEVVFLETDKAYQVATNFVGSKYIGREKPCWRYNKAVEIMDVADTLSVDCIRDALDATQLNSSRSTTLYSLICDLQSGDIYVYNYHDFSKCLRFNLEEELLKGGHELYLCNLFPARSAEYQNFIDEAPVMTVRRGYDRNINVALMFFGLMKAEYPKVFQKEIGVEVLSQVGLDLARQGKLEDAVRMLEHNAKEFPDSAKAHFELGDVYLKNNQPEEATSEFEKVLAIDPEHRGAREALDDLIE